MEYQIRNWYHFIWLCGDHIVEQHVHNLDVACWAMGAHPVSAVGMGGRQVITRARVRPDLRPFRRRLRVPQWRARHEHGPPDPRLREQRLRDPRRHQGQWHSNGYRFTGPASGRVRVEHEVNPYVQEHIDLLDSIIADKPINELKQVAESTLTAIMGRMSAYTGKAVTWEQALELEARHLPQDPRMGPDGRAARAQAGRDRLI